MASFTKVALPPLCGGQKEWRQGPRAGNSEEEEGSDETERRCFESKTSRRVVASASAVLYMRIDYCAKDYFTLFNSAVCMMMIHLYYSAKS